MKEKDGFTILRAVLVWMPCHRQTRATRLDASMQSYQVSPPTFQACDSDRVLLQKCWQHKWTEAILQAEQYYNIWANCQPRLKGVNWTGQPTTLGDFYEHGSCANKGWRESVWSVAEHQAHTSPLCLLWSCCTRAFIGELPLFPDCYSIQSCCNTEMSAFEGAETHPRNKTQLVQECHLALRDSFITPNWVCLRCWSSDEYVVWHFSDAKIHPCHWPAQSRHILLTSTRRAQAP